MKLEQFGAQSRWVAAATFLLAIAILTLDAAAACRSGDSDSLFHTCQSPETPTRGAAGEAQSDDRTDEIERLREMLQKPGAEGRPDRERAVERLLAMPNPAAHRVLCQALAREEDPDALRTTILSALGRHLLGTVAQQFGGADADVRRQIFNAYLGTLSEWWRGNGAAAMAPLRTAARATLMRVHVRDVEKSARLLLETGAVDGPALFRCIADLQSIYLGQLLAEHVEDKDSVVRDAARASLRLLTFEERGFQTRAEFEAWFGQNSEVTYVDLAERAARMGAERMEQVRERMERARLERSRDVVRAHADATPGVHWAALAKETLVTDPAQLDVCLDTLREALAGAMPDDSSAERQRFCRALLDRWKEAPPAEATRRSLLLEVAAYCARPSEIELATEIQARLLAQLESGAVPEQLAALRGLQRFPSVESRAVIVRYARSAVEQGADAMARIETALATLGSRTAPRWLAPSAGDADRGDWIALIRAIWERPELARLRESALSLALTEDAQNKKLDEVFELLLEFAKDTTQDSGFRSTCVIRLLGFAYSDGPNADRRVAVLQQMLDDPDPSVRRHAAQTLGKVVVVKSDNERRAAWLASTIAALRARLPVEPTVSVLEAFVDCMIVCGREPNMPELAIGAINSVLTELGSPSVPTEHQSRVEPLMRALVAIANDENAANGPWLGATRQLLAHKQRASLRLLLDTSHAAVDMAKKVDDPDATIASQSRRAMHVLIGTALLKPPGQAWTSTDALKLEARDVRFAFIALDAIEAERVKVDDPAHRLLRLEVGLAGEHYREVVQRATAWLTDGDTPPPPNAPKRETLTPAQKDYIRLLAAEAQLGLNKPDLAAALLEQIEPTRPLDARALTVFDKVGRKLPESDAATARRLFDRARKATPVDDPAFRARLIDWATTSVRVDPGSRDAVWAEVREYASLFEAQDCPTELRVAFEGLRGTR